VLRVRRDTLARALRTHGEDELAERALSLTDEELRRIGKRAHHYAFSEEHALVSGASMGTARALSVATVDVLEGAPRELRWEEEHDVLDQDSNVVGRTFRVRGHSKDHRVDLPPGRGILPGQ
jgi:hypothetical protein